MNNKTQDQPKTREAQELAPVPCSTINLTKEDRNGRDE